MLKIDPKFAELIAKQLKEELKKDPKPFYVRRPWIWIEGIMISIIAGIIVTYAFM